MRISDVSRAGTSGSVKKKSSSQATSGFSDLLGGSVDAETETQALSGVAALSSLNGLLNVQEVDLEEQSRFELIQHGEHLLQFLDELQIGMLQGHIPISTVQRMVQEAKNTKNENDDPKLNQIISEIELRAEVEIAKLEKSTYS